MKKIICLCGSFIAGCVVGVLGACLLQEKAEKFYADEFDTDDDCDDDDDELDDEVKEWIAQSDN